MTCNLCHMMQTVFLLFDSFFVLREMVSGVSADTSANDSDEPKFVLHVRVNFQCNLYRCLDVAHAA